MAHHAMTRRHPGGGRRFGILGRSIAGLVGLALAGAGSAVMVLHGWLGVLEGLPALALGLTAIYMAAVGREPRWWRGS
jgi:hypothetical protein